ncbi:DUF4397 domain-containing protein [Mucilaginibacter gotjawali]|uniref:Uncharacterized protein n=2 Tax=Mucilaginibacter gotjawali TaxID=1550579 RepID=A0A110B224_9SPHI|nr:DUF4397 domain-containing protein [Mucilaginibacter gotjawali]MBB3055610.1 hypothetical protein [Mucilaginibacter gotjawali]BAU53106.1 hypothetical protein MgSA37_01273 [Mucilaginibacter gotjawali]
MSSITNSNKNGITITLVIFACVAFLVFVISSCGKSGNASPKGLNIQYEILNLSPDMMPVSLFIDNKQVNSAPYIFGVRQGYFYVPSTDVPYQIRSVQYSGTTYLTRTDSLKAGAKYSLFIVGSRGDGSDTTIFTVDTSGTPTPGRGKIRFVDASPSGTGGLDVLANDTPLFSGVAYQKISKYIELPVGNYDLKIQPTGTTTVIKELTPVTIQDGRLYTLYAYGYTSRADTAAFNAATIVNK